MPPEPDNKMDELLKAYAKKRAEEAGAPPELHPATRRLLQGEVARVYGKKAAAESRPWYRSALLLWPRFAFAGGIVVLLGGTLWMLNHNPEKQTYLALNDTKPTAQPAPATEPVAEFQESPARGYDLAARAKQSADRKLEVAQKAEAPVMLRRAPAAAGATAPTAPAPATSSSKDTLKSGQLAKETRLSINPSEDMVLLADRDRLAEREAKRPALAPPAPELAPPPRPAAPVRGLEEQLPKSVSAKSQLAESASLTAQRLESTMQPAKVLSSVNETLERQSGLRGDLAKASPAPIYRGTQTAGAAALSKQESLMPLPSRETLGVSLKNQLDFYSDALVTSWTNTVHDPAQNWAYFGAQNAANLSLAYDTYSVNAVGAAQNGAGVPALETAKKANGRDTDSDFAVGFGRFGEDGGSAKAKGIGGVVNSPVSPPASGPAAAGSSGGFGGGKTDDNVTLSASVARTDKPSDQSLNGFGMNLRRRVESESERRNWSAKILDSFQLVQDGEAIRLVDADGSVYAGMVVTWTGLTQLTRDQARSEPAQPPVPTERYYRTIEPSPYGSVTVQNSNTIHFQVSGTNKSTRELVVVTGQLGRLVTAAKPAVAGPTAAEFEDAKKVTEVDKLSVQSGRTPARVRSGFAQTNASAEPVRITGVATIGTNQIKLDAIRR